MESDIQCAEGIVLQVIPFRNYDQIVTIFTDQGLLKLICKKGKRAWNRYTPLTKVEVAYKEKKSEIFACEEISSIQSYLNLRERLIYLEAGCELLQAIRGSQLVGKAAPLLYQLLLFYLDKIPHVKDPWVLVTSFKLKILRHEGILNTNVYSMRRLGFSEEEFVLLEILSYSQSYNQLANMLLPINFKVKVDCLFKNQMQK